MIFSIIAHLSSFPVPCIESLTPILLHSQIHSFLTGSPRTSALSAPLCSSQKDHSCTQVHSEVLLL